MKAEQLIELRLSPLRLQTASAGYERGGLRFVRMIFYMARDIVTTDRIQVTDEAVRNFNPPFR